MTQSRGKASLASRDHYEEVMTEVATLRLYVKYRTSTVMKVKAGSHNFYEENKSLEFYDL